MSKGLKLVLSIVVGLLIVVALAVWFLASNLDGIVKRVVERVGTDTLGTPVRLAGVNVSLADASATLNGLTIANPPGFDSDNAFTLGSIEVAIDLGATSATEVVLPRIIVDQAQLTYEQQGTRSNLQTLLDNLEKPAGEQPAEGEEAEVRLVIEEFQLNDAGMTLVATQLAEPLQLKLADVRLQNIGRQGAGATAASAARQILEPILDRAVAAGRQQAQEAIEGRVREEVEKQKDKALESLRDRLKLD